MDRGRRVSVFKGYKRFTRGIGRITDVEKPQKMISFVMNIGFSEKKKQHSQYPRKTIIIYARFKRDYAAHEFRDIEPRYGNSVHSAVPCLQPSLAECTIRELISNEIEKIIVTFYFCFVLFPRIVFTARLGVITAAAGTHMHVYGRRSRLRYVRIQYLYGILYAYMYIYTYIRFNIIID